MATAISAQTFHCNLALLLNCVMFQQTFVASASANGFELSYKEHSFYNDITFEIGPVSAGAKKLQGGCRLLDLAGSPIVCFWWSRGDHMTMCLVDRHDPCLWELLTECQGDLEVEVRFDPDGGSSEGERGVLQIELPFDLAGDVHSYPYRQHLDVCRHVLNTVSITQLCRIARTELSTDPLNHISVHSAFAMDPLRGLLPGHKLAKIERRRMALEAEMFAAYGMTGQ